MQSPVPKIFLRALLRALPKLNHYSSVPKCFFLPEILAASMRAKGKSSVQSENIHSQIQQARTVGSSEESWYSWINKKACPFLSHRSLCNDRHPPGRVFHAPPPLIIQTTSATTPFVLRAAPAHVDWWTHDPFFFPPFLIPPYVSMAHMTSLLSHLPHPDTLTHFLPLLLSVSEGVGRGSDTRQLFFYFKIK